MCSCLQNSRHSLEAYDAIERAFEAGLGAINGFGEKVRTTSDEISLRRLDFDHGINILETQMNTGGIIDPETGLRFDVETAIKRNLVSKVFVEEIKDGSILKELVYGHGVPDTLSSSLEHDKVIFLPRKTHLNLRQFQG